MPLSITCPACREPLDVDEEYRAWKVRCPQCRHEFYPDQAAPPPRSARPAAAEDRDRDRDRDDLDAPPRRRRRRPLTDAEVIDRARAVLAGPASWLRVFGVLGLLLGIAGAVGAAAFGSWVAENPARAAQQMNVPNTDELLFHLVVIGVASALCVVLGGLIAYGAVKMGRLESHGWAMASAVIGIASVFACNCALVTTLPLGIWALVMLNKPEVVAGFDAVRRRNRPRRYEDADDRDVD